MNPLVVRPVRFTDDVRAMRRFLETLGLRARIESERGGWVDMVAGAGMVALHSAAESASQATPGETRLSFEAEDLRGLAARLRDADVPDVTVYDEAYGQVLTCRDPTGDPIVVDGRSDDLHGYRMHQADPDPRWRVMPVRFTPPRGDYGPFLEHLGLSRQGGDDFYVIFSGDADGGQVGLHYAYADALPIVPGPGAVHLTFETTEPLDAVAERLIEHGFSDARVEREDFGAMLSVTDPDGRECQVHEPMSDGGDGESV